LLGARKWEAASAPLALSALGPEGKVNGWAAASGQVSVDSCPQQSPRSVVSRLQFTTQGEPMRNRAGKQSQSSVGGMGLWRDSPATGVGAKQRNSPFFPPNARSVPVKSRTCTSWLGQWSRAQPSSATSTLRVPDCRRVTWRLVRVHPRQVVFRPQPMPL
jgi:hypothetical protein